jgi:hypothetical protein
MFPHDGTGGWMPKPMHAIVDSVRISRGWREVSRSFHRL